MPGDVAKEGGVQCRPAVPLVHLRNSDAKDSLTCKDLIIHADSGVHE